MANATNPSESLALRYSYAQLQHPYKAYADQVSALMRAYGKILSVENTAERQGMLDKVQTWARGHKPSDDEISKFTGPLKEFAQAVGLGGMGTAFNTAKGAAGAAGTAIDGVMLPLDVFKGGLGAIGTFFNEALNFQLSEAQVREIGTAYGSVLQAQSQQRGSWYSSLDNVMAYASAAFSYAIDWVTSMIKGSESKSWGEHVQRAFMDTDRKVVAREFAKVSDIGGVSGEKLGKFLANGGVAQNAAGTNMTVTPPTTANPVPAAPAAPTTPEGEPVVAQRDTGAVLTDAAQRSAQDFTQTAGARLKNASPGETLVIGGTGLLVGTQMARGMAEGYAAAKVNNAFRASDAVEHQHGKAQRVVANLEAKLSEHGSASQKTAAELAKAKQLEAALDAKADKLAQKAINVAANKGHFATQALNPIESDSKIKSLVVDSWRKLGRVGGDLVGRAIGFTDGLKAKEAEVLAKVAARNAELAKNLPSTLQEIGRATTHAATALSTANTTLPWYSRMAGGALTYLAPATTAWDAVTATASGDTRKAHLANVSAVTIAVGTGGAALMAVASGMTLVAAAPVIAVGLGVSGIAAMGYTAYANHQHETQTQALSVNTAPTPPARDGAAGTADPGLAAAAIDHAKAQQAAQAAAGGMRAANVKIGAVRMNEDGSLPPLRFTGPGAEPLVIS